MAETDPGNILIIDKKVRRSQYANNEPGVQILIDQIGGVHNVHLARLWSARKFLLVEGKDVSLLKHFHSVLYPDAELPLDAIPSLPIGGWTGWPYAVGSSMTLRNAMGDRIETYCILDRDYHSDDEIRKRYAEARDRGVRLYIWGRKEIENYLLHPKAIRRVLAARIKGGEMPSLEEVRRKILDICESERTAIVDAFASAMIQNNRKLDVITVNKSARARVEKEWHSEDARLSIVSGKTVLSELSKWTQERFGVTFGAPAIARQITQSELPVELKLVIQAIEESTNLPSIDEQQIVVS
jgi:hypothetical protein